jgi:hypothetical protein
MYALMAMVALSTGISNISQTPSWLNDYGTARQRVGVVNKPMAVFVGRGQDGWEKVIQEGLDASTNKLLAQKYVCVYLDRDTAAGKALADQFQVASRGLIISDRTGAAQAYSLSGSLTRSELVQTLEKYSDTDVKITETIVREAPEVRYTIRSSST